MTRTQERETYRRMADMKDPFGIACKITRQVGIQSKTGPIPRGFPDCTLSDGDLIWEVHYLKPGYFLALFYDKTKTEDPDPYTEQGLNFCQAWIFKYDSQHNRLSLEACYPEVGNRLFSRLAHRLATE